MTTFNALFNFILKKYNVPMGSTTGLPTNIGATLQDHVISVGNFVLNGATPVTVNDLSVAANSVVMISLKTVGGTVGAVPAIQTITVGSGFTVSGTALDTSTYNYHIEG